LTASDLRHLLARGLKPVWNSVRDLLPTLLTILVFQLLVLRKPVANAGDLLSGLVLVVIGLTLLVRGLELGLFPLGEQMAHDFARKGSLPWLLAFAFALGFGATFAEPALAAVSRKASEMIVTAADAETLNRLQRRFVLQMRLTVAVSVGAALATGVLRILLRWPVQYLVVGGYVLIQILTPLAPQSLVGVAYDSGGITISTVTAPMTAALGVGLAASIKGRSPLQDGFGTIALAAMLPVLFVLIMGILWS